MSARIRSRPASDGVVPLRPSLAGGGLDPAAAARLRPVPRSRRVPWAPLLIGAGTLYCLWLGHVEYAAYHRLAVQRSALLAERTVLLQRQTRLKAEVAYDSTDAYVAAAARQQLGLVGPGEVPLAPVTAPANNGS